MIKLTLTYVKRTERISAKTNKPYTSLSLKAIEYGQNFLSGFGNKENENWKEGMVVEVAEVKEVTKEGKIYYNFDMPRTSHGNNGEVMKALEEVRNQNTKIILMLTKIGQHLMPPKNVVPGTDIVYPENDLGKGQFESISEEDSLDAMFNGQ